MYLDRAARAVQPVLWRLSYQAEAADVLMGKDELKKYLTERCGRLNVTNHALVKACACGMWQTQQRIALRSSCRSVDCAGD